MNPMAASLSWLWRVESGGAGREATPQRGFVDLADRVLRNLGHRDDFSGQLVFGQRLRQVLPRTAAIATVPPLIGTGRRLRVLIASTGVPRAVVRYAAVLFVAVSGALAR